MAEVTAMRNNALPYPIYGFPWVVVFPIYDATGAPLTAAGGLDSEKSINGDTFSDCTNEAVEIATSSGVYYLILTGTEMGNDIVAVQVKSNTGKTAIIVLYPRKLPQVQGGTSQGASSTDEIILSSGASAVDDYYVGCVVAVLIDSVVELRCIIDYVGSTKTALVDPPFNTQVDSDDTYDVMLPDGVLIGQANLTAIEGVSPLSAATLNLKKLNVVNSSGDAIVASSTGSNGKGIAVSGHGSGDGIRTIGGANGDGFSAEGGATAGNGIRAEAVAGNGHGLMASGQGSGKDISALDSDISGIDVTALAGSAAAATNLRRSAESIYFGQITGAATSTTLIDSALTQADNDHWKGRIIIFLTGALAKQASDITAFDAATDKLTFTALTQAPSGGELYVIV